MKRPFFLLLSASLLMTVSGCRQSHKIIEQTLMASARLIPVPVRIEQKSGYFTITENTAVFCPDGLRETAAIVAEQIGIKQPVNEGKRNKAIFLLLDTALNPEGYNMVVDKKKIEITGGSAAGVYYAFQTLRQLVSDSIQSVPCLTIRDHPRFSWRGLMLDCSRTFQSPEYLRKTIERMSFYKMNVLHLHLTDDQGWRIEIKSHPELTVKGARFHQKYNEPERHQGFYSQMEMKEIIRYAAARGVTIVPEIEMPGHSTAVLACYPQLSCTGKINDEIFPFFKGPGITTDILCAGNEETYEFIEDVINEIAEIFPSSFIHIGGDEAPKLRWHKCPKCQAKIKNEGLKNEKELQSYFISQVEKYINSKGRRLIGWSEIIEGGLAPNAAVMDWIGGAKEATVRGQDVVMSPTSHCYFDYPYTSINSEKAYGFNPVAGLDHEQSAHVLGLQANFWSHIDREPELVDKQLYPRLLSIAERAWSPDTTINWVDFRTRLAMHLGILEKLGINYKRDDI